jgi:hypothetical protein
MGCFLRPEKQTFEPIEQAELMGIRIARKMTSRTVSKGLFLGEGRVNSSACLGFGMCVLGGREGRVIVWVGASVAAPRFFFFFAAPFVSLAATFLGVWEGWTKVLLDKERGGIFLQTAWNFLTRLDFSDWAHFQNLEITTP